jgi:hypothetical protein
LFCLACAEERKRALHADSERRRRERLGEAYRQPRRERYATDEEYREARKAAAAKAYAAAAASEGGRDALRAKGRKASAKHRDKVFFDGNRAAVFARDDGRCRRCGTDERLHVHHLDGRGSLMPREDRNNDIRNLVLLCVSCHARTHRENEARAKESING